MFLASRHWRRKAELKPPSGTGLIPIELEMSGETAAEGAEHQAILAEAVARPRKRSFAEVIALMPDAGDDADFERVETGRKTLGVFD